MRMATQPLPEDYYDNLQQKRDHPTIGYPWVPMSYEDFERRISEETEFRFEWIDGAVYNMTGSSPKHSAIATRFDFLFNQQIGFRGPCRTHRDEYVRIPDRPVVVPDVVLTCDPIDWDEDKHSKPYRIQSPLVVVEVLSPNTMKYDRREKFSRYKLCPTLEVHILAHQNKPLVEVSRRANNWEKEVFSAGQTIELEQCNLKFPVDRIYEGILA